MSIKEMSVIIFAQKAFDVILRIRMIERIILTFWSSLSLLFAGRENHDDCCPLVWSLMATFPALQRFARDLPLH